VRAIDIPDSYIYGGAVHALPLLLNLTTSTSIDVNPLHLNLYPCTRITPSPHPPPWPYTGPRFSSNYVGTVQENGRDIY